MMGTPSLAVIGSAPAELIQDNINGLLCENDTIKISEKMNQYLYKTDESGKRALSKAARQTIPQSWSIILTQVEAHYSRLSGKAEA